MFAGERLVSWETIWTNFVPFDTYMYSNYSALLAALSENGQNLTMLFTKKIPMPLVSMKVSCCAVKQNLRL